MFPFRWVQFTGPHWTVMAVEFRSYVVTSEGAADGAGDIAIHFNNHYYSNGYLSPASRVITVTFASTLPPKLVAPTVIK